MVLCVAPVVGVWLAGSHLARPTPQSLGPPPAGMRAVAFDSSSGDKLRGWLAEVESPRAAAVLMHPLRGSRGSMVGRARLMNELGMAALLFDFRAHGESTGAWTSFGHLESRDASAAVDYVRDRWPGLPVVVVGVSLGGAAALLAEPPLAVDAMVLESVFPDIATAVENRLEMRWPGAGVATPLLVAQLPLRSGIDPDVLAPEQRARSVAIPVLVLAGSRDLHTPPRDTLRLYRAFPGDKELLLFENARHQDLQAFDRPLYNATVSAFLGELLD